MLSHLRCVQRPSLQHTAMPDGWYVHASTGPDELRIAFVRDKFLKLNHRNISIYITEIEFSLSIWMKLDFYEKRYSEY